MQILKKSLAFLLIFCLLFTFGCQKEEPQAPPSLDTLFKQAMQDAMLAEESDIHPLVTLTAEDKMAVFNTAKDAVLLVTWHKNPNSASMENPIRTDDVIFAFSIGEMQAWYNQNREGVTDWNLRFAQLLGLPSDAGYTHFTTFWVAPRDVVRPAYVTDVTKQMSLADKTPSGEFGEWFDEYTLYTYFKNERPWTRLGYTYDWAEGEDVYGLTEFLVQDAEDTSVFFTMTNEEFVEYLESSVL